MVSAERFGELLGDLQGEPWDVMMLNETLRKQLEEYWTREQGHIFAAAGHEDGRRGVGALLHKTWRKHVIGFRRISERLCYLDAKIFGVKYRFASVYFPGSSYQDAEVQKVYDTLSDIVEDARKHNFRRVVAGDFNARVGQGEDTHAHPLSR